MEKNKYFTIYQFIKNKIENNEYLPEEKIPSENEFCKIFDVSRNTVRKAISLLISEGILTSVHGKGVFVMKKIPLNFLLDGTVSFKETSIKNKLNYETRVPIFEILTVDEQLSKRSHFKVGETVYHILRVRNINGIDVILDENYFLYSIAKGLSPLTCMDSVYNFLEHSKGLKIHGSQKIISVEIPTEKVKKYLKLSENIPIALVKNFAYLDNGILFEYTESRHRGDNFIFSTFAKRI